MRRMAGRWLRAKGELQKIAAAAFELDGAGCEGDDSTSREGLMSFLYAGVMTALLLGADDWIVYRSDLLRDGEVPGAGVPGQYRRVGGGGGASAAAWAGVDCAVGFDAAAAFAWGIALLLGMRLDAARRMQTSPMWQEVGLTGFELVMLILFFDRLIPQLLFTRTKGLWIARIRLLVRGVLYLISPVTLAWSLAAFDCGAGRSGGQGGGGASVGGDGGAAGGGGRRGDLRGVGPGAGAVGGGVWR